MNLKVALFVGGLLGPFGGGVVTAMLPELGASFTVSPAAAASSLTAYLLPFAAVMLVSGTLGERWGVSRSIRIAYVGYALASVLAALAPWFWLFQASRGLQGVANAFTTPLLMATLASTTPPHRLGRTLGTFGAMQALGQTSAPLFGGLAAESSWRWAFAAIALVAAVLAACPLPADEPRTAPDRPDAGEAAAVLRPVVLWSCAVAFVAGGCLAGLSFLVAFRLDDTFALSPGIRGLLLTAYGVAGILGARPVGTAADRLGRRRTVGGGLLVGGAAVAAMALTDSLPAVVAAWAVAGLSAQSVLVGVNSAVLSGSPRGGAISVVTSLRFAGMALSPAAFTGLYHADPVLGFVVPACVLAATVPAAAALRAEPRKHLGG